MNNAFDFVQAAKLAGTNIDIFELTEKDILKRNSMLNLQEVWKNAHVLQGIKKHHCIQIKNEKCEGFLLSCNIERKRDDKNTIHLGDWYEIEYDGALYPGEITKCSKEEFEVNTMEPAGKHWKWPKTEDKIYYPHSKLLRKLQPPILVNSRGYFTFET